MQNPRGNWRTHQGVRALKTIDGIEQSIRALEVEDLLDLHDLFRTQEASALFYRDWNVANVLTF